MNGDQLLEAIGLDGGNTTAMEVNIIHAFLIWIANQIFLAFWLAFIVAVIYLQ